MGRDVVFAGTTSFSLRGISRGILNLIVPQSGLPKSELFGSVFATGIWALTDLNITAQQIIVEGWALPPFGVPVPYKIAHNGVPLENFVTVDRPDVAERFVMPGGGKQYGFRCEMTNPDSATAEHEISFVDGRTLKPFNPHHTLHYIASAAPLPENWQRKRVSSSEDLGVFLVIGASAYTRLDRVLLEYFGKRLAQADSVLDWGSGYGRVFRYFPSDRLSHFTGIDIDPDNVEWSRANYPAARFEHIQPRPPTPFPEASFDVVFGISVFTHLPEGNQFEWLEELHRITRPGAAVLVTVHGETAWMLSDSSLQRYAEWRTNGFIVSGKNSDLDEGSADSSLYYTTYTTRRYIFEKWSRYFRVLAVLDGAIANHQDLVVLERI